MQIIAHDLIRDIIMYVPYNGLRDLSKASPIFDIEINSIGIKIFYSGNRPIYFADKHVLIVKTRTGKKDIFEIDGTEFKSLFTGITAISLSINWATNIDMKLNWWIDRNGLGVAYYTDTLGRANTGTDLGLLVADLRFYLRAGNCGTNNIYISKEISYPIVYIDLLSTNLVSYVNNTIGNRAYMGIEQFDVIHYGREWIKPGSWHKYKPDYIQN